MPRRLIPFAVPVAVAVAAGLLAWRAAGDGSEDDTRAAGRVGGLAERQVTAGAVTVKLRPLRLDAGGATIKVSFDTHSEELDQDLARLSRLEVGGRDWPGASWDGGGPGGHHREGELRFPAGGPAAGVARLTISGLPEPVEARWTLPGG